MQELIEIWKQIPGYEGFYECSNFGKVRSVDRYVKYKHGGKSRFWPSKLIKPSLPANGYMNITLKKEGVSHCIMVHRIVGLIFKTSPGVSYNQINHIDGNKLNNREDNLEWVSQSQNMRHAFAEGFHKGKGATHYKAKKVVNRRTGEIFLTIQDAADSLNMKRIDLWEQLSGRYKNNTDLRYL